MARVPAGISFDTTVQKQRQEQIRSLFEATQRIMGLRLCFHDRAGRSGLPEPMRYQAHTVCLGIRRNNPEADSLCVEFDNIRCHRELASLPSGRIHTCPHGLTEIAVPVFSAGSMVGVLFAGPCWSGRAKCPYPELTRVPDMQWLKDRLLLLHPVAVQLGGLLALTPYYSPPDRRQEIEEYIRQNIDAEATLPGLAEALKLSVSRTSHVVNRIFNKSFSAIMQEQRMQQASLLLVTSDLPVNEISALCGLADPNYFSRLFRKYYGCAPVHYRNRNALLGKYHKLGIPLRKDNVRK